MPLVSRTRATLRSAEFGFFGVVVYTRVHTPRRWGEPFSAGVLVFSTLSSRPLRTSWLIVGMGGLDLLPALGWCSLVLADVCACCPASSPGARCRPCSDRPILAATHRPAPAVGRVALPGTRPMFVGPESVAPRDSAPPPSDRGPGGGPRRPGGFSLWSPRRTANGSRPRAPWAQQTTIRVPRRPVKAGSLTHEAGGRPSSTGGGRQRGERHRDRFSSRVGRSPRGLPAAARTLPRTRPRGEYA